jgi:chemotaxis protein MotA
MTNFIFIPISENLLAMGAEDFAQRKMIMEGIIMLKRKMHPLIVEERMKSYLLPSERNALLKKAA